MRTALAPRPASPEIETPTCVGDKQTATSLLERRWRRSRYLLCFRSQTSECRSASYIVSQHFDLVKIEGLTCSDFLRLPVDLPSLIFRLSVAQRSISVSPTHRTVKSNPLRSVKDSSFPVRRSGRFRRNEGKLYHTPSGLSNSSPYPLDEKRRFRFVQVLGSEAISRLWRNEGKIYHTPIEAVKSMPLCSRNPATSRFVRCSPVSRRNEWRLYRHLIDPVKSSRAALRYRSFLPQPDADTPPAHRMGTRWAGMSV